MLTSSLLVASLAVAASALGPYRTLNKRQSTNSSSPAPAVVGATYDGSCFYPKPTDDFVLNDYLGRWYQVAGTLAPFTAGCKCIFAEYALNVCLTLHKHSGTFTNLPTGQRHSQRRERLRAQWNADSNPRNCHTNFTICRIWTCRCFERPIPRPASARLPRTELHRPRYWSRD